MGIQQRTGGVPPIVGASTDVTAFVGRTRIGPLDRPVRVDSFAEFVGVFGGLWDDSPLSFAVLQYFEHGGRAAVIVRVGAPDATATTSGSRIGAGDLLPPDGRSRRTGLWRLEEVLSFDLLVVPPLDAATDVPPDVWRTAATYCLERRALLLIDPPMGAIVSPVDPNGGGVLPILQAVEAGRDAARNAAIMAPWLRGTDPLTGTDRTFAPAGAVAGIITSIDRGSGVWTAPAGLTARFRPGFEPTVALDELDCAILGALGVNCLRMLPAHGAVIWGARTRAGAAGVPGDWQYIPVRRMALFLEKSIALGLGWAQFEPNGETLWSRARASVEAWLHELFRRGAFRGSRPRDGYFVRCDRTTMTQADLDAGRLLVQVGFAPARPAEFVLLTIAVRAGPPDD